MIQNLNITGEQFLANLQALKDRIARTQAQVTSGVRVGKPSDDPTAVGDILQLESDIGRVAQVATNLNTVKGHVDTAEGALQTATQILLQIQTLAAQGATGTASPEIRAGISQQIGQLLTQLVSVSQTKFGGVYVFGGDQDTQASYQVDLTSATGVARLVTTVATRQIQDATGVTFADSKTAQDIFDHRNPDDSIATDNVFAAVNSLRVALANDDQTGIDTAIDSIHTASDYLSQQLAFYGGVQNQVSNAIDLAKKFQLQYQTALSAKRDTDIASAAIDLTQEQTSMQAAIQGQASMPRGSLFDYLQNGR
jgi:flagellar hook-associated protein 3 FlgL